MLMARPRTNPADMDHTLYINCEPFPHRPPELCDCKLAVFFERIRGGMHQIAAFIKRALDLKYGPTWHVVVGKNFGSYCTHGELYQFRIWRLAG